MTLDAGRAHRLQKVWDGEAGTGRRRVLKRTPRCALGPGQAAGRHVLDATRGLAAWHWSALIGGELGLFQFGN